MSLNESIVEDAALTWFGDPRHGETNPQPLRLPT